MNLVDIFSHKSMHPKILPHGAPEVKSSILPQLLKFCEHVLLLFYSPFSKDISLLACGMREAFMLVTKKPSKETIVKSLFENENDKKIICIETKLQQTATRSAPKPSLQIRPVFDNLRF